MYVFRSLLFTLTAAILVALVGCGPKGAKRAQIAFEERVRDQAEEADPTSRPAGGADDSVSYTGARTQSGVPYTQSIDSSTLGAVAKGLSANNENKNFAQKIILAQAVVNPDAGMIKIILTWSGIEKPLIFEGSLKVPAGQFANELQEKSGQNSGLRLFAHALNAGATLVEASVEDRDNHQAKILVQVNQREFVIQAPQGEDYNKLPDSTRKWIENANKKPLAAVKTATSVLPEGRSFYQVQLSDGTGLSGDLLETIDGGAPVKIVGPLFDSGARGEMIGNSQDVNGGELVFKVLPVPQVPVVAVPKAGKPAPHVAPSKSAPAPLYLFVLEKPKTSAQVKPAAPAAPAAPPASPRGPPKGAPPPAVAPADAAAAHWMVQQLLADQNNPRVQRHMVDYFAKPVERAKAEWAYVNSTYSRWLTNYISIVGGEQSPEVRQKLNYAEAIINVLRGEKFPAIFSWQSYLESNFDPNARSKDGAEGFWQFIPTTRNQYFVSGEKTSDPYDSTKAAVRFLTDLLKMWDSDVKMAVASYHAGQANIEIACREVRLKAGDQSCESTKNYRKSLNYDVDELKNLYRGLGSFWHIVDVRTRGGFGPEGRKYVLNFISGSLISFNPQAYGYKGKAVPKN